MRSVVEHAANELGYDVKLVDRVARQVVRSISGLSKIDKVVLHGFGTFRRQACPSRAVTVMGGRVIQVKACNRLKFTCSKMEVADPA